jgi:cytoskeletal protein CcmA (bactofilin family)
MTDTRKRGKLTRLGLFVARVAFVSTAAQAAVPPVPREPPPPPETQEVSVQEYTIRAGETHKGNVYRVAPAISIEGTLDGDLYVTARSVRISGTVTGDVFAAGADILVTGKIEKSFRAAGANVVIDGTVEGNVLISGANATLGGNGHVLGSAEVYTGQFTHHGTIDDSLRFTGGTAILGGKVLDDADVTADSITVEPGARVEGDLSYSTRKQMDSELRAITAGDVSYAEAPIREKRRKDKEEKEFRPTKFGVGIWIAFFIASFLFGCALLAIFKEHEPKVTQALHNDALRSFGIGFVSILVTIAVCLSVILVITIPFIVIYLFAYCVAVYLGKVPVAVWLGRVILGKLKRESGPYMALFVGLVVLYFVFMIPILGWVAQFVAALLGLGAMTMTYLAHRQARRAAPVGAPVVSL